MKDDELRAFVLVELKAQEGVAVERRQEQVANTYIELNRLNFRTPGRLGHGLVVLHEKSADEAPAKVREREALGLQTVFRISRADDEIDEGKVGIASVDGKRGDASPHDDRECEEALADDFAEGLERADAFSNAFEPAVGSHRIELELALLVVAHGAGFRSVSECPRRAQWMQTGLMPHPSHRAASRREGQRCNMPMWQSEKSYPTGSVGSKRARAASNFLRRLPRQIAALGESQISRQAMNVHVHGNEQPPRIQMPKAQIDAVRTPRHPSKEKH